MTFTTESETSSPIRGRVRDISLGGVFIETHHPLEFGTRLQVTLQLGGETMTLPAITRWCKPDGMGVQFGLIGARETYIITELANPSSANR